MLGRGRSLEAMTREAAQRVLKAKKDLLVEQYKLYLPRTPALPQQADPIATEVNNLPWPNFQTINIDFPFKTEPSVSQGTAFYIGKNRVATAGHVAEALEIAPESFGLRGAERFCFVFNYTNPSQDGEFEPEQFVSIKR